MTTSVMQFPYKDKIVSARYAWLRDFTEDTYRTLTAVDSFNGDNGARGGRAENHKVNGRLSPPTDAHPTFNE